MNDGAAANGRVVPAAPSVPASSDQKGWPAWLTWRRFLAFGLAAIAVRVVIPDDRAGQAFSVCVQVLSFVVVWIGVLRIPRAERRPPLVFAVGLTFYVVGDLFYYFYLLVRDSPRPFPSIADAFYLTDLPIFAASILLFIRRAGPGRDVVSLIDAALVATVSGLVTWVYIIEPTVVASDAPLLERAIAMAYPLGDVVLATLAARLLLLGGRRPAGHVFLALAFISLALADSLYNFLNILPGLPAEIEPYHVLYMLWYGLAAAGLLHPSMSAHEDVKRRLSDEADSSRLVILSAVVLVAPALSVVEAARAEYRNLFVVAVGSVGLFLLVMARMNLLMRALRRAQLAAEAANQAKSAFLATMSHEIRTPLNPVIGLSNVLSASNLDPLHRSYADSIAASARSLLGLIDDILDFSKIESGAMSLGDEPFDVYDCVESALDVVASEAQSKGLELSSHIDAGVPAMLRGDIHRLRQVMVNLLSNAVKFTENGSVSVEVACEPAEALDPEDGNPVGPNGAIRLHVVVRDTGIGIPAGAQRRIFDLFVQAEATAARRYKGTGLGLAISRRLCELMGGRIWVKSEEGHGSEFHFTAKVGPVAAADGPRMFDPTQVSLTGRRLLVVDGDSGSRDMVVDLVARWGMVTAATHDVDEALAWLDRGDAFDVAIVDTGLEGAVDRLRRAGHCNELPIVALAMISDPLPTASDGYAGWLVRPVKSSPLFDAFAGVLFGGSQRAAPAASNENGVAGLPSVAPLQILVAEDHPLNQQVALALLEKLGHHADVVPNGHEVLRVLGERSYDVVLMDMQMPDMDGLEATRQITERWAPHRRPHIVAVTANALDGDREACLAAGMDDYLSKPITMRDLAAVLSRSSPPPTQR